MQLQREPKAPPTLRLKTYRPSILDYEFEDVELVDYDPHPHIPPRCCLRNPTKKVWYRMIVDCDCLEAVLTAPIP